MYLLGVAGGCATTGGSGGPEVFTGEVPANELGLMKAEEVGKDSRVCQKR